ncbi:alpha-glucosides permease Mph3p [Trichomonascus vanleenenianus]|uniref:alpha-glucosides permease Mph3p n=1 Tax=Trichomonascus vanleenenianus TaxID=2268995 RepID=UPI003ECB1CC4
MIESKEKVPVADHLEESGDPKLDEWLDIAREGQLASEREHSMGLMEGFKLYPKACFWSIVISCTLIMEGYDLSVLGGFYAFPEFQKKYGEPVGDGTYQLTAAWQSGLSNGGNVGEIIGIFINGYASDRWGHRKVLICSLLLVCAFVFLQFFAPNVEVLLVGEILCGIPWGVFQTSAPVYASEVCPLVLRGYLTVFVNLAWVLGSLIVGYVIRGCLTIDSEWAYRIPFAIQWVWPIPLMILIYLAPESPWYLVRRGRYEDAEKSLKRLTINTEESDIKNTVSMMRHTNEVEKELSAGTTYWDCFKGSDRRRTEIACVAWAAQTLCGGLFQGWVVYLLQAAGITSTQAYNVSLAQAPLGVAGTVLSWFLMTWCGRRKLYVGGLLALFVLLVTMGFVAFAPESNQGAQYIVGALLMVFTFVYDMTVGPVCYALVAEISSTRLRQKTVALGRNAYNIVTVVGAVINPYLINPTAANLKGKTALVWAATCLLCFIWAYFRVPETKGRTFEELDLLFDRDVPARKFKSYKVDAYEEVSDPNEPTSTTV